ncbi:hypothetical protein [uncultured Gemmiger sp.]|uniref:hypothetical protein n=1 Tax=uncultured Gemmiger sp. TaxID=1623490 RepID=UPI0025E61E78|nr:hypothetical protein [uncultured Gemmiger sp.]
MKHRNYWALFLTVVLLAAWFPSACFAEDHLQLDTRTETEGNRITVTVQLWDYIDPQDGIQGLQIDVDTSSLDQTQLHVEEPQSLIEDTTAYTNTAVWNPERGILRLNYLRFEGQLPAPTRDVMTFVLQVDPNVAQGGTVTLPVTAKLQMVSGLQTTLRTDCQVTYDAQAEGYVSVTITWGALDYTYSDGVWNPDTYLYEGESWSDNNTGFVTVENEGNLPTTAQVMFTSSLSEIAGSFYVDGSLLQEPIYLGLGESRTANLVLEGKPGQTFQQTTLGTVTIQIGEE